MTPEGKVLTLAKLRQYPPRRRSMLVRCNRPAWDKPRPKAFLMSLDFPWMSFGCLDFIHQQPDKNEVIVRSALVYLHEKPWSDLFEISVSDLGLWPFNAWRPGSYESTGAVCLGETLKIQNRDQVEELFWSTVNTISGRLAGDPAAAKSYVQTLINDFENPKGLEKIRSTPAYIRAVP